jgi:hypothetical protein
MKVACLLVFAISIIPFGKVQDKDPVGDFSKSPTEHIIIQIEQPFAVRSVNGTIVRNHDSQEPLAGVLFEIEGPGGDRKIRRATTDAHGRFKISHVPMGTYKFKATLNGFQSVMGTIVVSKAAGEKDDVKFEMPVGV